MSREQKSAVRRHKKNTGRVKIAIGALILLVCVAVTIALTKKSNEPTTVADVEEGECFNGELDDLSVVDCGEPHARELFKILPPADANAAYPGEDALRTEQGNVCTLELLAYYGGTMETAQAAGLELFPVVPSEAQWNDGAKDTFCLVGPSTDQSIAGSIKGQGGGTAGATTTVPPAPGG
jgi:hypothetical protein